MAHPGKRLSDVALCFFLQKSELVNPFVRYTTHPVFTRCRRMNRVVCSAYNKYLPGHRFANQLLCFTYNVVQYQFTVTGVIEGFVGGNLKQAPRCRSADECRILPRLRYHTPNQVVLINSSVFLVLWSSTIDLHICVVHISNGEL